MTAAAPAPSRPPYERSAPVLSFTVHGIPISQGSKSFKGTDRRGRAILVESSKHLKPWRQAVTARISLALTASHTPPGGWPLLGPLAIDLVFTMRKPVSAPKTRQTWPIVYPDVDKLARAIFDAGSPNPRIPFVGAWADDSQIVDVHAVKVYPGEAPGALRQPGVTATVYLIGPQPVPAEPGVQVALFQELMP